MASAAPTAEKTPERRWRWILEGVLLALPLGMCCAVPFSLVGALWLNSRPCRVIQEWKQPADLDYKSFGPYSVYVLEGPRNWSVVGSDQRRYELVVARSGAHPPDHGHMLDYSFHPGGADIETHIRKATVEWTPEGVTFCEDTGHRLFIPKKMFIGGR